MRRAQQALYAAVPLVPVGAYLLGQVPSSAWHARLDEARRLFAVLQYVNTVFPALVASAGLGLLGFALAYKAIDLARAPFAAAGLSGVDLLKRPMLPAGATPERVPECMGLPTAAVYLLMLMLYIPCRYLGSGGSSVPAELYLDLATFLSAILSIYAGALLGFVDDVLDIRWRYKLPIPLLSSIPMLAVYIVGGGATSVVVPAWPSVIRAVVGRSSVQLGVLYYIYMMLLAIFCTNCINILAGINGVEVIQGLVIALSMCVNDVMYLNLTAAVHHALGGRVAAEEVPLTALEKRHLFSLNILLPFVGTSAALLAWNRYPSRVFVGDTYCYFAGMVLATCGVLGHYSKTLLLFFLPQIANFVLSCPQLFGLVPCPRHRVPDVDAHGALRPSSTRLAEPRTQAPWRRRLTAVVLAVLERLRLAQCLRSADGTVAGVTNLSLLNALLVLRGVRLAEATTDASGALRTTAQRGSPHVSERQLWYLVLTAQVLGSTIAFLVRYQLAAVVFPVPG